MAATRSSIRRAQRSGGEVTIGAGVGEEVTSLVHREVVVVLRGAAIAPEEHFLSDELVAGALFLDDIAAAEHQQGGRLMDCGGA